MKRRHRWGFAVACLTLAVHLLTSSTDTMAYEGSPGEYINALSLGEEHSAAVDNDGNLWIWGYNEHGQLGNDSQGDAEDEYHSPIQTVPIQIMEDVASVSLGKTHSAAIKTDGTLWMWGSNFFGELGNGGEANAENPYGEPIQTVPVQVMEDVATVSLGWGVSAAIKTDGTLWMWGANRYGELGNGGGGNTVSEVVLWDVSKGESIQTVPVQVMEDVAAVSLGRYHSAAIKTDGTLWMWGSNEFDQLGNASKGNGKDEEGYPTQNVPVQVMSNVAAVSLGKAHSAALGKDGSLWTWGLNDRGQLGDGSRKRGKVPAKIMEDVVALSLGQTSTAALKTDGTLWMWGSNTRGQLGNNGEGNEQDSDGKPIQTVPVQTMEDVAAVSLGSMHGGVQKNDGTLWMWGYNYCGELGNGKYFKKGDSNNDSLQLTPVSLDLPLQTPKARTWIPGGTPAVPLFTEADLPASGQGLNIFSLLPVTGGRRTVLTAIVVLLSLLVVGAISSAIFVTVMILRRKRRPPKSPD